MTVNTSTPPKGALTKTEEKKFMPMFDIPFFIGVFLLLFLGLAVLYSSGFAQSLLKTGDSYTYINKQIIAACVGIVIMLLASFVPQRMYYGFIEIFYVVCVILLAVVLVVSNDSEKRWLYIGTFQFQPSEVAKLAVIMFLAKYLTHTYWFEPKQLDKSKHFTTGVLIPGIIFGICFALVIVETHLSGAILIFSVGIVMIIAAGCKLWQIAVPGVIGGALAVAVVNLVPYMHRRIEVWRDPTIDPLGDGFQPIQSLLTIGSGGLFGLGYGNSRQKFLYLPEPQNDFILSVGAEELGFIGILMITILFLFLIWRGFYIAMRARDSFSSLVVVGIISRVAIQTILNFAVVSNIIPTTGISLPFFSYGGTALVVLLAEMGIVLNISRYANLK